MWGCGTDLSMCRQTPEWGNGLWHITICPGGSSSRRALCTWRHYTPFQTDDSKMSWASPFLFISNLSTDMSEATTPSQNQAPSKYSITTDVKRCCNGRHPLELSTDFNYLRLKLPRIQKSKALPHLLDRGVMLQDPAQHLSLQMSILRMVCLQNLAFFDLCLKHNSQAFGWWQYDKGYKSGLLSWLRDILNSCL